MGKLILHRKKNFNGMTVGMDIFINEKPHGKLASGETKEFDLEPGTYTIKVQQNIKSGSKEITVTDKSTISYAVTPTLISLISFISPLVGLGLLFLLHFPLSYTALILLPGAISSIYLLTAGKTNYFIIKQIN